MFVTSMSQMGVPDAPDFIHLLLNDTGQEPQFGFRQTGASCQQYPWFDPKLSLPMGTGNVNVHAWSSRDKK